MGRCGVETCPCNDGDPCNYKDHGDTKAMPHPDSHDGEYSTSELLDTIVDLHEQVVRYRNALEFYAHDGNYVPAGIAPTIWQDNGSRAREALSR